MNVMMLWSNMSPTYECTIGYRHALSETSMKGRGVLLSICAQTQGPPYTGEGTITKRVFYNRQKLKTKIEKKFFFNPQKNAINKYNLKHTGKNL